MNLLISSSLDPYFNLATEEYLLKNSREDFIFLYINQPCVVVGKHQNTLKETNSIYTKNNNILIARRLSGGGAVYHDPGNLNFSFIKTLLPGETSSYERITHPMFQFLKTQIIAEVALNERNDFLLEGKKISGSAMHLFKDRVLAHATLLVDCNLNHLSAALHGNMDRYTDKSIASKKVAVKNISTSLPQPLTAKNLAQMFEEASTKLAHPIQKYNLDPESIKTIDQLSIQKYGQDHWIYGYSPRYQYSHSIKIEESCHQLTMFVSRGIIESVRIEPNIKVNSVYTLIFNNLIGKKHNIFAFTKWLESLEVPSLHSAFLSQLF